MSTSVDDQQGQVETEGLRKRKFVETAHKKLEEASQFLRRKIPYSGHFLAPKRLWLKRVPTSNCDVVIVFPPGAKDSILLWLLSKLRQSPGLTIHVRHHASSHNSAFYITASFPTLLKAAEEYHLYKALRADKGGGFKEFCVQELLSYENSHDKEHFFTSEERQWLILRILESIRAKSTDANVVSGLTLIEGQPIIPKCLVAGIIRQVFPLHEPPVLEMLQRTWVRDIFSRQPLDEIAEYFGAKIGMYFAWLGHYTTALVIPAVVGFIFWTMSTGKNQTLEDAGYVMFSIFNIVWVTTYLQAWKRYSAELAFRWGTLDQRDDLLADPRPLFRGPLHISPVTKRPEPYHAAWKRHAFRYCVSVPVIMACLVLVFCIMVVSLQIQDYWDAFVRNHSLPHWLSYLPKILLAVVISLMDEAYFKIAVWLNDKVPIRQFVSVFVLYRILLTRSSTSKREFCGLEYHPQLAALLIARQVIGNLKESALPYMLERMRLAKLSFDMWGAMSPVDSKPTPGSEGKNANDENPSGDGEEPTGKRMMSQAELESTLYKYDGTFSDHLEMTIQLGYVILFSAAFSPAALCALLNNLIEIRVDAFKLVCICQRPFGRRVPNIGTWQTVMEYMSIMAVLVNCALIGLSGQVHRIFSDMNATQTILLIVALEHIMLIIRFIITCAIPDIPGWLATEMAKMEWARREAIRGSTTPPSPEEATSKHIGRFSVSPSHSLMKTVESRKSAENLKSTGEDYIKETTPLTTPTTPGASSASTSIEKQRGITADSIREIPPFRPRKSKELTPPEDASSSDSDLLKSIPMWPPRPRSPPTSHNISLRARPIITADSSLSDSAKSISSQEGVDEAAKAAEELAAKKTRVKQSLMKRARSVAIFSLKLKERRAREAQEKNIKPAVTPTVPLPQQGGELSCIPIEKLIQLEDLKNPQRSNNADGATT